MTTRSFMQNAQLEGGPFSIGQGPLGILLIHGFTATTAEVRLLGDRLAAAGYSVKAPLLPGHGSTPEELNRQRWQDWAVAAEKDLFTLQQSCKTVWVGGESLGGLVSLYLAEHHPELAGVLLYAPAIRVPNLRLARFIGVVQKTRIKHMVEDGLPWKGYTVVPVLAAAQMYAMQKVVIAELEHVRQPLMVVQGRLDKTVDPAGGRLVYERVQSEIREYHWLEQSPHCLLLAGELDAAVVLTLNFLNRTVKESTRST